MRSSVLASGVVAAVLGALATSFVVASAQESTSTTLPPSQARTIALSRCGTNTLSTQDANCRGFDAREIRESTDTFVLGFENNKELGEKHVMQLVVVFDLSQIAVDPDSEVSHAALGYAEASTTRRSPTGESEYGVLPSCNTKLGVPTTEWNGRTDAILPTRPTLTAGVTPATTGEYGSWDVTPQIREWLAAGQQKGTLVMGGDDQSPDIHEQAMCLSYVFDMGLNVEVSPKP
jgi:hypothetical protein